VVRELVAARLLTDVRGRRGGRAARRHVEIVHESCSPGGPGWCAGRRRTPTAPSSATSCASRPAVARARPAGGLLWMPVLPEFLSGARATRRIDRHRRGVCAGHDGPHRAPAPAAPEAPGRRRGVSGGGAGGDLLLWLRHRTLNASAKPTGSTPWLSWNLATIAAPRWPTPWQCRAQRHPAAGSSARDLETSSPAFALAPNTSPCRRFAAIEC